jgi:hypothetical protein
MRPALSQFHALKIPEAKCFCHAQNSPAYLHRALHGGRQSGASTRPKFARRPPPSEQTSLPVCRTWWLLRRAGAAIREINATADWRLSRYGWFGLAGIKTVVVLVVKSVFLFFNRGLCLLLRTRTCPVGLFPQLTDTLTAF